MFNINENEMNSIIIILITIIVTVIITYVIMTKMCGYANVRDGIFIHRKDNDVSTSNEISQSLIDGGGFVDEFTKRSSNAMVTLMSRCNDMQCRSISQRHMYPHQVDIPVRNNDGKIVRKRINFNERIGYILSKHTANMTFVPDGFYRIGNTDVYHEFDEGNTFHSELSDLRYVMKTCAYNDIVLNKRHSAVVVRITYDNVVNINKELFITRYVRVLNIIEQIIIHIAREANQDDSRTRLLNCYILNRITLQDTHPIVVINQDELDTLFADDEKYMMNIDMLYNIIERRGSNIMDLIQIDDVMIGTPNGENIYVCVVRKKVDDVIDSSDMKNILRRLQSFEDNIMSYIDDICKHFDDEDHVMNVLEGIISMLNTIKETRLVRVFAVKFGEILDKYADILGVNTREKIELCMNLCR